MAARCHEHLAAQVLVAGGRLAEAEPLLAEAAEGLAAAGSAEAGAVKLQLAALRATLRGAATDQGGSSLSSSSARHGPHRPRTCCLPGCGRTGLAAPAKGKLKLCAACSAAAYCCKARRRLAQRSFVVAFAPRVW